MLVYILTTPSGKVHKFYTQGLAYMYQDLYGGTIKEDNATTH